MPTTLDTARDYLVWDNREDVVYTSVATAGDVNYAIASAFDNRGGAKWRVPTFKEMAASGGVYTGQDRVLLLPVCNMPGSLVAKGIKPRDRITKAGGSVYTVLSADLNTAETWWKITGRNLVIANDLKDLADLYTPANVQDAAANRVPVYPATPTYAAVACRLQEITGERLPTQDKLAFTQRYTCYLAQRVVVTTETQVRIAGATYQVRGYNNPDRIDELMSLDLEKLS